MSVNVDPTTPRLVYDLIPVILASNDHWWTQDYIQLSRVSKEWLVHIRRKLYSCPLLLSFQACSQLARTLQECPFLVELIHGLDLQPICRETYQGRSLTAAERADLRYLLQLEGLRTLKLGGQLAVRAERFLNIMANADSLEELHINGSMLQDSTRMLSSSLEWDECTAYRFPNLKRLRLTSLELEIMAPFPLQSAQCPLSLVELTLENVDVSSGYLSSILDTTTLKILNIAAKTASEFDGQLGLLLSTCCIETMRYEVQEDCSAQHTILGLDTTTGKSLRHLYLKGLNMDEDFLEWIGGCCQKLEKLVISGRTTHICVEGWGRFLDSEALPLLGRLGIPDGMNVPPFKVWDGKEMELLHTAALKRRVCLQLS